MCTMTEAPTPHSQPWEYQLIKILHDPNFLVEYLTGLLSRDCIVDFGELFSIG